MKRLFSGWMALVLVCVFAATVSAVSPSDVTKDATINMMDVARIYAAASGNSSLTAFETALADVDFDGAVTMKDVAETYNAVSKSADTLPKSIDYQVQYVDMPSVDIGRVNELTVIETSTQWQSFCDEFQNSLGMVINRAFRRFDQNALIVIPVTMEQQYVVTVAANDAEVFVPLVQMHSENIAASEHAGLIFVSVAKADVAEKTVKSVVYHDRSAVIGECENVKSFISIGGNTTLIDPIVIRSAEECAQYSPAEELTQYDDAFFEDYVLVRTAYNATSGGYGLVENAQYIATEDRLMIVRYLVVPWYDVTVSALSCTWNYIPVPKEYDVGQTVEVVDTAVLDERAVLIGTQLPYEVEQERAWTSSEQGEEAVLLIQSADELTNAVDDAMDISAYDETFFEDRVMLLVSTFSTSTPRGVFIDGVCMYGEQIRVVVTYEYSYGSQPTLDHREFLVSVKRADLADITDITVVSRTIATDDYGELM